MLKRISKGSIRFYMFPEDREIIELRVGDYVVYVGEIKKSTYAYGSMWGRVYILPNGEVALSAYKDEEDKN